MKRNIIAAFSGAIGALVCLLYGWRADIWTAVTIAPAWIWLVFGIPAMFGRSTTFRCRMLLPWILYLVFFVEEPRSLLRTLIPLPKLHEQSVLQIASLNASGNAEALRSALETGADIICIQESPNADKFTSALESFEGYTSVIGIDASLIVRGKLSLITNQRRFVAVQATVGGRTIVVCSLRLATTPPRFELWSWEVWKSQMLVREQQRAQIAEVRAALPNDTEVIVAGDFNVPQSDPVPKALGNDFHDAFDAAGRGWCNTILSDVPLLRIDQIWSRGLTFVELRAKVVPATDHRLVQATFY